MFRTLIKIYHKFLIKKNIIISSNSCQIQQNPHCNLPKKNMFPSKWMIFPYFPYLEPRKKNKKPPSKRRCFRSLFAQDTVRPQPIVCPPAQLTTPLNLPNFSSFFVDATNTWGKTKVRV